MFSARLFELSRPRYAVCGGRSGLDEGRRGFMDEPFPFRSFHHPRRRDARACDVAFIAVRDRTLVAVFPDRRRK